MGNELVDCPEMCPFNTTHFVRVQVRLLVRMGLLRRVEDGILQINLNA